MTAATITPSYICTYVQVRKLQMYVLHSGNVWQWYKEFAMLLLMVVKGWYVKIICKFDAFYITYLEGNMDLPIITSKV